MFRLIQVLVGSTVFVALSALSTAASAGQVRIAVASNFAAPMPLLVSEFEQSTGHSAKVAYGSSGKFYAQILHGAPFDVFLSADQAKPTALLDNKMAVPSSRMTYAVGALVLWSSDESFFDDGLAILMGGDFRKIALANPKLAPYGQAALEVLDSLGQTAATTQKWVQGENIAQTFQFVASGNADLGFVARSQLVQLERNAQRALKGQPNIGSVWIIPQSRYSPVLQDAVLLMRGADNPAAIAWLDFLRSPKARVIIESYGYTTP